MNLNLVLDLIDTLRENVTDYNTRRNIYVSIIGILEPYFDSVDELQSCLGEDDAFDEAWEVVNPPDADEEQEYYGDIAFGDDDDERNFS